MWDMTCEPWLVPRQADQMVYLVHDPRREKEGRNTKEDDVLFCVLERMCDMTHSHVWHEYRYVCHNSRFTTGGPSGIFVATWRKKEKKNDIKACMCDMTRLHVWHDSLICVPWQVVLQQADPVAYPVNDLKECSTRVTWRIHTCDVTRWCVCHDLSFHIRRTQWRIQCAEYATGSACCKTRSHTHTILLEVLYIYSVHIWICMKNLQEYSMRVTSRFTTGGPSGILSALNPPLGPPYVKGQVMAHTSADLQEYIMRVTWRIRICDVTRWYVCHDVFFHNRRTQRHDQCASSRSVVCVWRDVFTCVTWLADIRRTQWYIQCHRKKERQNKIKAYMCDMTYSHVWHDSLIRVPWLSVYKRRTQWYIQCHRKKERRQGVYVWHDTFTRVTLLADTCAMTLILQQADPVVYSVHDVKAIITGADRHKFSKVSSTVFLT